MKELNRILVQYDTAITLANSNSINKKMLAVILFDNLVEIQLLNKVNKILQFDDTNWYSGTRKYSRKVRKKATQYIDGMLSFCKQQDIISEKYYDLLNFTHKVRNKVYHQGESKEYFLTISIVIYISFITDKVREWKGSIGVYAINSSPDSLAIDFGNGKKLVDLFNLKPEEYFEENLDYITSKYNLGNKSIQEELSKNLLLEISVIERRILFLKDNLKNINFYDVLGSYWYLTSFFQERTESNVKPKNIDRILIIFNFLKNYLDELDDIKGMKNRNKEFIKLFNRHKRGWNNKYKYWIDLEKYKEIAISIKKDKAEKAIQRVVQIQMNMLNLYEDSEEASFELDGYLQHLRDLYRGK